MLFTSLLVALLAPFPLSGKPSAHAFQPPRPNWIKTVEYLKETPNDEGYEVIQPQDRQPGFKRYHRELSFFASKADQKAERPCKILRYNPNGYLEEDIENIGVEQLARSLNADGTVCSYTHFRSNPGDKYFGKYLDGYSVSPFNKSVSRFSNGNGNLIVWDKDEQTYSHTWYWEGEAYLEQKRPHGQVREQHLYLGNAMFLWTPQQEALYFQHEAWTKDRGKPPYAQIMDSSYDAKTGQMIKENVPNDPIKQDIRRANSDYWWSPTAQEQQAQQAQLVKDYATRRASFMTAYGERLARAGQTWKSLGLEDVLEGR